MLDNGLCSGRTPKLFKKILIDSIEDADGQLSCE
ncbi:hypothetical protein T12_4568 [Trichinella patagoniensis]|uniref:Uncharacterized protein n=1 Tax=Trichinella patagoniensis TaxID=990121 RepID=A0A0V0Z3G1_9BILA|nr:hypothetical protein T12_12652 [Trichinella patagoniensis]KRY07080.1 hypothetical protein T12_4568 [Trichinella patagoniensis]